MTMTNSLFVWKISFEVLWVLTRASKIWKTEKSENFLFSLSLSSGYIHIYNFYGWYNVLALFIYVGC